VNDGDDYWIVTADFEQCKYRIINSNNLMRFFERRLCDESFLRIEFNNQNFEKGKGKLGDLAFDECYGYVSLLGMGGSEKVENLQKVNIKEYISITTQALRKIK
jgi:hypothetical protein